MTDLICSGNNEIIDLYTDLASNPDKDFGWDKGLSNAVKHGYLDVWLEIIPGSVWQYCAAVGNPFELGEFNQGAAVLDLGCGAGVDLCVASLLVGKEGRVSGVDVTPAMVELARHNVAQVGLHNVSVHQGAIEKLPFDDGCFDVVISNGAINLSTSKEKVFDEIFRVLSSAGRLYFADMIKDENHSDDLVQLIEAAGFVDVKQVSLSHYKTSVSTIGATFSAHKT